MRQDQTAGTIITLTILQSGPCAHATRASAKLVDLHQACIEVPKTCVESYITAAETGHSHMST